MKKLLVFEAYVYIQQKEFLKIYIFLDKNADGLFLLTIVQRYFHFALIRSFIRYQVMDQLIIHFIFWVKHYYKKI